MTAADFTQIPNDPMACRQAYSAAICGISSARSNLAAQNLNSGIFPNGSSAGLVSRLAGRLHIGERDEDDAVRHRLVLPRGQHHSAAPGGKHAPDRQAPGPVSQSCRATAMRSPTAPARRAPRSAASSRRCASVSSWRPVVRMNGNSASGISSGSVYFVATSLAMPFGRGKPLSNTTSWPGWSGASVG